jgi:predicted Zn-dependent peptidase
MLSLESTGSRMNHIARQEIYFGRQFGLDEITAGIEAVSAADVERIATDLFRGPMHTSVLGNLKGYRPRAAQLHV